MFASRGKVQFFRVWDFLKYERGFLLVLLYESLILLRKRSARGAGKFGKFGFGDIGLESRIFATIMS